MSSSKFKRSLMSVAIVGATGAFLAACGSSESDGGDQTVSPVVNPDGSEVVVSPIVNVSPVVEVTVDNKFEFNDTNAPMATITGFVFGTDGSGVEGATVTVAGADPVTTDSNGSYEIPNVPVVATFAASSVQEFTDILKDITVTVSVASTDEFVGAQVSAQPFAQFVAPDLGSELNSSFAIDQAHAFVGANKAPAQDATVALNNAVVKGVLRHKGSQDPVVGAKVVLDMTGLAQGGAGTHTPAFTVLETAADGSFEFSNVPEDATFNLYVEGYDLSEATSVTTLSEVAEILAVYATPKLSKDDAAPFITEVKEVAYTDGGFGRLSDNADNQLTVVFSENIDTSGFNSNSLQVFVKENGIYKPVTVDFTWLDADGQAVAGSAPGKQLSLLLTTYANGDAVSLLNLSEDTEVVIDFLPQDFRDASGNNALDIGIASTDAEGNAITLDGVDYDSKPTISDVDGDFEQPITVSLKAFRERIANVAAASVEQLTQDDISFSQDFEVVQSVNPVFSDVDALGNGIQQLNNADRVGGEDLTAKYLQELLAEQVGPLKLSEAAVVETDVARLRFTPSGVNFGRVFDVKVIKPLRIEKDSNGNEVVTASEVISVAASEVENVVAQPGAIPPVPGVDAAVGLTADQEQGAVQKVTYFDDYARVVLESGVAEFDLLLNGVAPGYRVEVTSYNDYGRATARVETVLEDKIAPITVLQNAYGLEQDETSYSTVTFGQGGEQSQNGSIVVGVPVLPLTPRLFSSVDGSGETDANYVNKFAKLFDLNTIAVEAGGDAKKDEAYIDPAMGVYDDEAYRQFISPEKAALRTSSISIAFSEDIEKVADPVMEGLSNWRVLNDIKINDVSNGFATPNSNLSEDIIAADIADVYALASLVASQTVYGVQTTYPEIDFAGLVKDESGVVAGEFARVAVADKLPPLVKDATFTGEYIEIVFDKSVDISSAIAKEPLTLTISSLDGSNTKALTISKDSEFEYIEVANAPKQSVVRIGQDVIGDAGVDVDALFSIESYSSSTGKLITTSSNVNREGLRAVLAFDKVPNLEGVSWSDYYVPTGQVCDNDCFESPKFAMVNELSPLTASVAFSPAVAAPSSIEMVVTFASDFDLEKLNILDSQGKITEASVKANLIGKVYDSTGVEITDFDTTTTIVGRTITIKVGITEKVDPADAASPTRVFFTVSNGAAESNGDSAVTLQSVMSKYDDTQVVAGKKYNLF